VAEKIEGQLHSAGIPVVALHIASSSFDAMILHPEWLKDGDSEAMRPVMDTFSPSTSYAVQIREAILKKKSEGCKFILLLSLKDDRLHLVNLS
jgi:translation initiation factor 2-alpha kinase 4